MEDRFAARFVGRAVFVPPPVGRDQILVIGPGGEGLPAQSPGELVGIHCDIARARRHGACLDSWDSVQQCRVEIADAVDDLRDLVKA